MLYDLREVEIAKNATQPNLQSADRNHAIDGVFSRFFSRTNFRGGKFLELGPGHYEFCDVVKSRGGQTEALELDLAMVELGRHRGHVVHHVDLAKDAFWKQLGTQYDGVFCRGSINATWFTTFEAHQSFVQGVSSLIKPNGWGWISPWNANSNKLESSIAENAYLFQKRCFQEAGFRVVKCNRLHARRFHLSTEKRPYLIFLKCLQYWQLPW